MQNRAASLADRILYRVERSLRSRVWNIRNSSVCRDLGQGATADLKVVVIVHDDKDLPAIFNDTRIYLPLRVGNAIKPTKRNDRLTDDRGENISELNLLVNEMTGIYWIANHYNEIGNPAFVGFNHYRRHLQWDARYLKPNTVIATSGVYPRSLRYYNKIRGDGVSGYNTLDANRNSMRRRNWRILDTAFFETFAATEFISDYEAYWESHTIYYSNLFITDRETFSRYYSFIAKCIALCQRLIHANAIDLSALDNYYRRVYSFFLEHMTSFWLFHENRKKSINLKLVNIDYFDIPNLETSVH